MLMLVLCHCNLYLLPDPQCSASLTVTCIHCLMPSFYCLTFTASSAGVILSTQCTCRPAPSSPMLWHTQSSSTTTLHSSSPISNIGSTANNHNHPPTAAHARTIPPRTFPSLTHTAPYQCSTIPHSCLPTPAPTVISAPDQKRRSFKLNTDDEASPCAPQGPPTPSQRTNRSRGLRLADQSTTADFNSVPTRMTTVGGRHPGLQIRTLMQVTRWLWLIGAILSKNRMSIAGTLWTQSGQHACNAMP